VEEAMKGDEGSDGLYSPEAAEELRQAAREFPEVLRGFVDVVQKDWNRRLW
jgi:hypothetical protein